MMQLLKMPKDVKKKNIGKRRLKQKQRFRLNLRLKRRELKKKQKLWKLKEQRKKLRKSLLLKIQERLQWEQQCHRTLLHNLQGRADGSKKVSAGNLIKGAESALKLEERR